MHGILFHVEHSTGVVWRHRWRLAEPAISLHRVWQEQTNDSPFAFLESPVVGASLEVEAAVGDAPWSPVTVLSLSQGHATFRVEAIEDFASPDSGFMACAPGRHGGVSAFRFPRLSLRAGEVAEVIAHADAPVHANLLLSPGDFAPRAHPLSITNLTPATGSWTAVPSTTPVLSACPLCVGRRIYAYGHGDVDPALVREWIGEGEGGEA